MSRSEKREQQVNRGDINSLSRKLEAVVTGLGYEFVGIERLSLRSGTLLRVYADKASGITVDDCERISGQVSGLLDVEEAIQSRYTLEVSSPGLDRRLFMRDHYERFKGRVVKMCLIRTINGRRNLVGELAGLEGDDVTVVVDGEVFRVPLRLVEVARLVPGPLNYGGRGL